MSVIARRLNDDGVVTAQVGDSSGPPPCAGLLQGDRGTARRLSVECPMMPGRGDQDLAVPYD